MLGASQIRFPAAPLTAFLLLIGCLAGSAQAASKAEIDAQIRASLASLYEEHPAARELVAQAKGLLVFPQIFKAGFILGGEFGEGALLIGGRPVQYYRTTGLSIGIQAGAQGKSQVVMFMNDEVLAKFRQSNGWEAGVDGSVAVVEFGTGAAINSNTIKQPIVGFVFNNRGLMVNASLAGNKFWRVQKEEPGQVAPTPSTPPAQAPFEGNAEPYNSAPLGQPATEEQTQRAIAPVESSVARTQ